MIQYSKLGRYSDGEAVYVIKIISPDCYEIVYMPGNRALKKSLYNEAQTDKLIEDLLDKSFILLNPISVIDEYNRNKWGELILEYYEKLIPETKQSAKKIKL